MKAELVTLVKNLRAYRGYTNEPSGVKAFVVQETQDAAKVIEELAARVEMLEKEILTLRSVLSRG